MQNVKKTIRDIDFKDKIVLVRSDLNVPISNGVIQDDTRITSSLQTLNYLLEQNSKIVLLSHLGRVKSLEDLSKRSLLPVYEYLKKLLPNITIEFETNNTNPKLSEKIKEMPNRSILLLENTRFNDIDGKGNVVKKESGNDQELAKFWSSLGDVFVNDAFGTIHRKHASNYGISSYIPESCIGFLVEKEIKMLERATVGAKSPVVAIFGGAKVSDKIKSIENIAKIADLIIIGGGMAYTFQKAKGHEIGKSIFDSETFELSKQLLEKYGHKILLPCDVYASIEFANTTPTKFKIEKFDKEYDGMDIGPKTVKKFVKSIKLAKTVIWNGPLGVCEFENYSRGTEAICKAIAKQTVKKHIFSLVGGGDSAAAVKKLGFEDSFSHISTGGGATIVYLEGESLPSLDIIQNVGDEIRKPVTLKKEQPIEKTKSTSKSPAKPVTKKSSKEKSTSVKKAFSSKKISSKPVAKKPAAKKPASKKPAAKKSKTK